MNTFSPKLDVISENIVYLLSLQSRTPISEIARALKQPRKKVENRFQKLFQKKYIKPLLIYNYNGLVRATILLKLSHVDKSAIELIRGFSPLIKLKETLGMYDVSLLIISDNDSDLQLIIAKVNQLFHHSIQNLEVIYHDVEDTLGYKSFCHHTTLLRKYQMLQPDLKYELKNEDKKILESLKENPSISYKELAIKTGFGHKRIKEIISTLKKKGIIRFSIDPDYTPLGIEFHNVLIKINLAKRTMFEQNILSNTRIHWIKKGRGRWDYILSVASRNISEFIDITREIKSKNKDIIFDSSALVSKINMMRKC